MILELLSGAVLIKHVKQPKKTTKFDESFMICNWMLLKGSGEMAIVISTTNSRIYIEILENFLIPSIENWFGEDKASLVKQRGWKLFFIKSIWNQ